MAFGGESLDDDAATTDDRAKELADLPLDDHQMLVDRLNRDRHCSSATFTAYGSDGDRKSIQVQRQALYCSYIIMRGIKFSTFRHSPGDSMVLIRTGAGVDNRPARIRDIFVHAHPGPDGSHLEERYLVVESFKDLHPSEKAFDPYRRYPFLDIRLYYDALEPGTVLVKASDIVSHFASCPLRNQDGPKLRVVVSLARVSLIFMAWI